MIQVEKTICEKTDFGEVIISLQEIMHNKNVSFGEIRKATGIRYEIMKKYYDGVCCWYDQETLAKLCYVLDCEISDILRYIPPRYT